MAVTNAVFQTIQTLTLNQKIIQMGKGLLKCAHFHKKTRKMQLTCIKHTPFHENARILCKLDETVCIFLYFH